MLGVVPRPALPLSPGGLRAALRAVPCRAAPRRAVPGRGGAPSARGVPRVGETPSGRDATRMRIFFRPRWRFEVVVRIFFSSEAALRCRAAGRLMVRRVEIRAGHFHREHASLRNCEDENSPYKIAHYPRLHFLCTKCIPIR